MSEENTKSNSAEISAPELLVSSSPHIHSGSSVRGVMLTVILALCPACAAGVYYFGIRALLVIIYCRVFLRGHRSSLEQSRRERLGLLEGLQRASLPA